MDFLVEATDKIKKLMAQGYKAEQFDLQTLILLGLATDTREMLLMARKNQKHIEKLAKDNG